MRQPVGKLVPLPTPAHAWEHMTMDRIVGLPKTKKGHTAILVVVDRLTKMANFTPCKDTATAQDLLYRRSLTTCGNTVVCLCVLQIEVQNSPTSSLLCCVRLYKPTCGYYALQIYSLSSPVKWSD